MKKYALYAALVLVLGCTDEDAARNALQGAGYSNIEFTGYSAFSCSDDDSTCTGFTATGPTGNHVEGAVGCGFGCGKGCTIRLK